MDKKEKKRIFIEKMHGFKGKKLRLISEHRKQKELVKIKKLLDSVKIFWSSKK